MAAKEILQRSMLNNLEPFANIQQIILKEREISSSNNFFIDSDKSNKDYSTFIP